MDSNSERSTPVDLVKETSEEKQDSTEQWRAGLRKVLDNHLFYFHKHRWTQIAAEIRHRIRNAPNDEARAEVKAEMDAHYETQFHPETSREALLAEADKACFVLDIRELPAPGL